MRTILTILLLIIFSNCNTKRENTLQSLKGYVVYIVPNNVRFVETKRNADSDYLRNFSSNNFKNGISFQPNCVLEKIIQKIKVDTIFDENPALKEHASFLKKIMVFPAEIKFIDTADNITQFDTSTFKLVSKGIMIEFPYKRLKGIVLDLKRIN